MTNLEKLRRKMIEAIHGCDYEKAIKKEKQVSFVTEQMIKGETGYFENGKYWESYPITLSRVLQAFGETYGLSVHFLNETEVTDKKGKGWFILHNDNWIRWNLTKANKQACILEDQEKSTIDSLLKLSEK